MIRSAAVLALSLPIVALVGLAVPGRNRLVAAWILPALALSSSTLLLTTFVPPRRAGIAISAAWAVGLVVTNRSVHDLVDVFGAGGQMVALFALVAVSVPLILRRDRFDEMGLIA